MSRTNESKSARGATTQKLEDRFDTLTAGAALRATNGNVLNAAKVLGVSRRGFYNYLKRHPEVLQARDDAKEEWGDFIESQLHQLVREKNIAAVIFSCKTQLKDRGYVERAERTGVDGGPMEHAVTDGWGSLRSKLDRLAAEREAREDAPGDRGSGTEEPSVH